MYTYYLMAILLGKDPKVCGVRTTASPSVHVVTAPDVPRSPGPGALPVVGALPHPVPDGAVPGQPGAGASPPHRAPLPLAHLLFLPCCFQAAYCWRFSPYPTFLSKLLFWYMISLLFLFGAPPCCLRRPRPRSLSPCVCRLLLLRQARGAQEGWGGQEAAVSRRAAGASSGLLLLFCVRTRRSTQSRSAASPPRRCLPPAPALPELAASAVAAASSAPGRLTSCAASHARRSSASASSMMSPPVMGLPSTLAGIRPSAAAEIGKNAKLLPGAPPCAAALLLAVSPDHGRGLPLSAAPRATRLGAASPSSGRSRLDAPFQSALCARGLRRRRGKGVRLRKQATLCRRQGAPRGQWVEPRPDFVPDGVQLRQPLVQVALDGGDVGHVCSRLEPCPQVGERAHRPAGEAACRPRDVRHVFGSKQLRAVAPSHVRGGSERRRSTTRGWGDAAGAHAPRRPPPG